MIYKSGMPKVVGEFDAVELHQRIDNITAGGDLPGYEVERALRDSTAVCMNEVVGTHYRLLFRPRAFENTTLDGRRDSIEVVSPGPRDGAVYNWHSDDLLFNKVFALPEILTGTSRWPTAWLVGTIVAKRNVFLRSGRYFFENDDGKEAIEAAMKSGDARVHKFNPGQLVVAPSGALHRADIPPEASGYRYFKRQFPKIESLHSRPYLSLLRLF